MSKMREFLPLPRPTGGSWDKPPPPRSFDVTRWIKFERLAHNADKWAMAIKAMSIFNDLNSANFINFHLVELDELTSRHRNSMRRWGLRMTVISIRDAVGHAETIRDEPFFNPVFEVDIVKKRFADIETYLKHGSKHADFLKLVLSFRNEAGAHLSSNKLADAIRYRANHVDKKLGIGRWVHTDEPWGTRFFASDDIVQTAVTTHLWGLTGKPADVDVEADKILDEVYELGRSLADFMAVFSVEAGRVFGVY